MRTRRRILVMEGFASFLQTVIPRLKNLIQLSGLAVGAIIFYLAYISNPPNLPAQITGGLIAVSVLVFTLALNILRQIRGSIPHPMQLLCTLRDRCRQQPCNTRYQAGAASYLGRTGLTPAGSHQLAAGALIRSPRRQARAVSAAHQGSREAACPLRSISRFQRMPISSG